MIEKRDQTIAVKVTTREKEEIRAKANTVRLGMSEYIRSYLYATVMSDAAKQDDACKS